MTEIFIKDESAMHDFAADIAKTCTTPMIIYLVGELGVGKTTFVRGFLRALGYEGHVKSPTFTLIESYEIDHRHIHHFDLYRVENPSELEFIGIRDYFTEDAISLIEWPENGKGVLPEAVLSCYIEHTKSGVGTRRILFEGQNLISTPKQEVENTGL